MHAIQGLRFRGNLSGNLTRNVTNVRNVGAARKRGFREVAQARTEQKPYSDKAVASVIGIFEGSQSLDSVDGDHADNATKRDAFYRHTTCG